MKARSLKFLMISAVILIIILFSYNFYNKSIQKMSTPPVQLWISDVPYSSDPLDFDALVHHIIFYSIYSPLVTEYKVGEVTGLIAESWQSSDDFKTWRFQLRPNMYFENNELITAEIVLNSLKRVFYLLQLKKSQNGLVENIVGIESFDNISKPLEGLSIDQNTLIFKFSKPLKNFLSLISFGMYSIVHPSQYDTHSGQWKDKKKTISSAAYLIKEWDEKRILLNLRKNYHSPFSLENHSSLSTINITWDKNQKLQSALTFGTSDEDLSIHNREFFGGTISEIRFIRCLSYYDPQSPCFSLENRRIMRETYYDYSKSKGIIPIKSFFPLIMEGISKIKEDSTLDNSAHITHSTTQKINLRINEIKTTNASILKTYNEGFQHLGKRLNYNILFKSIGTEKIYSDIEHKPLNPEVDLCSNVSGIYIDKPQEDVQFMFKSKEGVMIPDTTGEIMKELENKIVNIQKINELIWDQAVIWPLSHYSIGFWGDKNKFNFSKINLARTPTMLELIELK